MVKLTRQTMKTLEKFRRKLQQRGQLRETETETESASSTIPQSWVPKGKQVVIAGRTINGMVYFGNPAMYKCNCGNYHESGVYIDPLLSVAKKGSVGSKINQYISLYSDMDYCSYQDMDRFCRGIYLDWLADGASDPDCVKLFPLLYFSGLERRFMLGNPLQSEKEEIIAEVKRLKECFAEEGEIIKHIESFLFYVDGVDDIYKLYSKASKVVRKNNVYEKLIALAHNITSDKPIDSETFLDMYHKVNLIHHKKFVKFPPLFRELFRLRFNQTYPNGLLLKKPKKILSVKYYSFNGEIETTVEMRYNNRPLYDFLKWLYGETPTIKFGNGIHDELNEHTNFVQKYPHMLGGSKAMALLPPELQNSSYAKIAENSTSTGRLRSWAQERVKLGLMVTVEDVFNKAEIRINSAKIMKPQWGKVIDKFAMCGFGVAPDINLWLGPLKLGDPVAIYNLGDGNMMQRLASKAFMSALIQISIGAYLFKFGKRTEAEAGELLRDHIAGVEDLTAEERDALAANIDCMLATTLEKNHLRSVCKTVPEEDKHALRAAVVKFAQSDKVVMANSVAIVEKIYSALGYQPDLAYSDLHAGEALSSEKGSRKQKKSQATELNEDRIRSIRSDTERVSKVLGNIFKTEDTGKENQGEGQEIVIPGLDRKHANFLKSLVEKEHWTEDAFANLAKDFELLPVGALETINEWVYERFEDTLVDEHEGFHVMPKIANSLKSELEKIH